MTEGEGKGRRNTASICNFVIGERKSMYSTIEIIFHPETANQGIKGSAFIPQTAISRLTPDSSYSTCKL